MEVIGIVASGDRVYTTLAYRAPMSILDAGTGEIIATVEATQGTTEILVSDGVAVAYTRKIPEDFARRRGIDDSAAALVAADGQTGKVRWQQKSGSIRPLALAIDRGRIVYLSGKSLVALDLKHGHELWKVRPRWTASKTLVTVGGVIVMQGGTRVVAHDATD